MATRAVKSTATVSPPDAAAALWADAGLSQSWLTELEMPGPNPALPSSLGVTTAAQVSIGVAGLAAAMLWHQRGGDRQRVTVDGLHAAVALRSERHVSVAGATLAELWDRVAGLYPCADGWIRLHTNFAHHRDGVLRLLECGHDRAAVAAALKRWSAQRFEDEATVRGLVVAALRTPTQWQNHPQAAALRAQPLVAIERIGDAPVEALPEWQAPIQQVPAAGALKYAAGLPLRQLTLEGGAVEAAPLAGIRVLDLTRIIAGPVCGRTLAAHGAEVLHVSAGHLPSIETLTIDTGRGKRTCCIDLRQSGGVARLRRLLAAPGHGADVFVQGYRPGGIAALGFGAEECARRRPGIVYVSLSAYGHLGPWANKRGFDSLVQTATGLNSAEAEAAGESTPRALPAQALDHASGFLMAFGAMVALHRRAIEGGSWHVRVSLARTAQWLESLGQDANGLKVAEPSAEQVAACSEVTDSHFGRLCAVRHPAVMSATPPRWRQPSAPLGTHAATW